jgi:hypothetical protein
MNETSKAALRRSRDPDFVQRYFAGAGLTSVLERIRWLRT